MILGGELVPISRLSSAFLSPPTPMHLQFAYYESSLVVEFLVEKFGLASLKDILADLAEGEEINSVISRRTAPIDQIGLSRRPDNSILLTRRHWQNGSQSTQTAFGL
jgi:hypothetical protein